METAQATMVGILTMRGYVIEYSEGNYIFCTEEELEYYKEQEKKLNLNMRPSNGITHQKILLGQMV